jgi:formate hydrogenlyase subunit 6/NADH:ubiquinone oxidoreductase subunit I
MCQKKCPTRALTLIKEEKKWIRDPLRCISCGYCVECCPKKCLFLERDYQVPTTNRETEVYKGA